MRRKKEYSQHTAGSGFQMSAKGRKDNMINSWALLFTVYSILLISFINTIAADEKGRNGLFLKTFGIPQLDETSNPLAVLDDANFDEILEEFSTIFTYYNWEKINPHPSPQTAQILQNLQV